MRNTHGMPYPDTQVCKAITNVIKAKKERLTGKTFLEKVKRFAIGFLKVAGTIAIAAIKVLAGFYFSG